MVPDVHQPDSLAEFLDRYLNLTTEFEVGALSVERIADIAMLAMAHSDGYAGTARLVSLMGGLPVPSEEPHDFWFRLWQESGSAIFMPLNIKHQVLRALQGDGAGLADQLLTAVSEMDSDQRSAAAEVIGEALEEQDLGGYKTEFLGEQWLRDVEAAAWRVLYATRRRATWGDQESFIDGWHRG